ncbi:MAG: hypothetical protein GY719_08910 [bacterium]|nr:hypothetical protein [bacterium]
MHAKGTAKRTLTHSGRGVDSAKLAGYVDSLQATGSYTFRREDALAALGISAAALKSAARRLAVKRRIFAPRRGFFAIVPLEYRSAGAPPPYWYIDDLMRFHDRPYYVGLLSAAELHGAAHQKPQEFQVVTDRQLRPIEADGARIRFFLKRHMTETPILEMNTQTGTMRVSTPEATAFDLLRYVESVGHLGNAATVLVELAESIDPTELTAAAKRGVELSVVQRLGFLLDEMGAVRVTEPLAHWLASQQPRPVALRPDLPVDGSPRNTRWEILVNEVVEADL